VSFLTTTTARDNHADIHLETHCHRHGGTVGGGLKAREIGGQARFSVYRLGNE